MSILVTGGAGYIGSHVVLALLERREQVIVLDDLSTGVRALVPSGARFVGARTDDVGLVRELIRASGISAVMHFAGSVVVPESVENPLLYYANNTAASRALIGACVAEGVKQFIFSSTAAVYGDPDENPVRETTPARPINPYGRSKLMTEWMLEDVSRAHDFKYVALRYFNVAGADAQGRTGPSSPNATHLIRRACQVALGRLPYLEIFGTDFPTRDGTCIRDYIHVTDLAAAHLLALDHLVKGGDSVTLNCGYGDGTSVRQVIGSLERVTGRKVSVREAPRRAGDPPALVANATRLKREFGWTPAHDNLDEIIASAYAWEESLTA
jgi:UDP-glucose 4-epimerase